MTHAAHCEPPVMPIVQKFSVPAVVLSHTWLQLLPLPSHAHDLQLAVSVLVSLPVSLLPVSEPVSEPVSVEAPPPAPVPLVLEHAAPNAAKPAIAAAPMPI
jgi:hypothetical protein